MLVYFGIYAVYGASLNANSSSNATALHDQHDGHDHNDTLVLLNDHLDKLNATERLIFDNSTRNSTDNSTMSDRKNRDVEDVLKVNISNSIASPRMITFNFCS